LQDRYGWEVEHEGGTVLRQYNEDGSENPSTKILPGEVVRASIMPRVIGLPRHDVLISRFRGERFVRRFGRGFLKVRGDGVRHTEYLQCIETTRYKIWVSSVTGQVLVTHRDEEVYL
jgi:hypothetical protein